MRDTHDRLNFLKRSHAEAVEANDKGRAAVAVREIVTLEGFLLGLLWVVGATPDIAPHGEPVAAENHQDPQGGGVGSP
jgi:hypothetical protein